MDTNIYATISIINETSDVMECKMTTLLQEPYIAKDASDYEATVVSFTLPIDLVPILICEPGAPSKLAYSMTFEYSGNVVREYLTYDPPNNYSSGDPRYYYIYNYSHFVDMVNDCLAALYTASTGFLPVGCTAAPYMLFDSELQKFSIIAQTAYSDVKIYMNDLLWILFDGFHAKKAELDTGRFAQIIIKNNYQNAITIPTGAPGAGTAGYIMKQDYSSIQAWNTIKSIILTSNIGIKSEIQTYQSLNGKYSDENIISEFTIDQLPASDRVIVYAPSQFRYHDIMGSALSKNIYIQFFMIDKSLNKYPVFINSGDMARIRLLFRRK
jgi:hypothetical protein